MASATDDRLGQVLIDFSTKGAFPEEEHISAAYVKRASLAPALAALGAARAQLETEIRQISHESAPNVNAWILHAKSIQEDIEQSKRLANSIVRQAERDTETEESLLEKENYVDFLTKEVTFNDQLIVALRGIQGVNDLLQRAEDLAAQQDILAALFQLENAWTAIADIPLEKTTRALRLLDTRCFDLRHLIHDQFSYVWNALVRVDFDKNMITISQQLPEQLTTLQQAVVGLKAYKELEKAANQLWVDLDDAIIKPRTNLLLAGRTTLATVRIEENSLTLSDEIADYSIKSLFTDLEEVIRFLVNNLPPDFIEPLSKSMMPPLVSRILEKWLDTAVPSSLDDMVNYQKALAQVNEFASNLDELKWPGVEGLHDWVSNAPKIWLSKKREMALDWTRNQFSLGLGSPQVAERIEKRMVAREEGENIVNTGTAVTQDWDAAWDNDADPRDEGEPKEQIANGRNRSSIEEERLVNEVFTPIALPEEMDDAADAWGWGDEDATETAPAPDPVSPTIPPSQEQVAPAIREMTISEKYWTTSIPQPVFKTLSGIYEDGATLTKPDNIHIPVSPAAPGLFSLPTLILAMYRSVSPLYYTDEPGGNMYLYNDAVWLAEKLKHFAAEWKDREDIPPRAYGMVKLDSEIKILESFGKRAYTNELNAQRTIITDLLGGAQNFFQQDDQDIEGPSQSIEAVTSHIREQAALWEKILPYSAWASATGSLVNAVATKLISDIFDLSDMSVDEAERAATLLSSVERLDSLFIRKATTNTTPKPTNSTEDAEIPLTSQFADKWMKMKFLSEVLQSNLKDVKFLWFESDLSLYFEAEEVVELIMLSFESNAGVRQAIREIRENPHPK